MLQYSVLYVSLVTGTQLQVTIAGRGFLIPSLYWLTTSFKFVLKPIQPLPAPRHQHPFLLGSLVYVQLCHRDVGLLNDISLPCSYKLQPVSLSKTSNLLFHYATEYQVHWKFHTDNMCFPSNLIWYHIHKQTHTAHTYRLR